MTTLCGIEVRTTRRPRGGNDDTSEYVMCEAVPERGVYLVRTDTIPGSEASIGLLRDASLIAFDVVRAAQQPERFDQAVDAALCLMAEWAPLYMAVHDAAHTLWATQELADREAGRTRLPVSDALLHTAGRASEVTEGLRRLLEQCADSLSDAPALLRFRLAQYEAHRDTPRPDALDVPRVYFRWARAHRDFLVRRAYALGVSKMEIHSYTSEARTTIDRILASNGPVSPTS